MAQLSYDFQRKRFVVSALVAVAALLAITACGGGDSSDSTSNGTNGSAPAITKAELVKKADAICRATDEVQKKEFNSFSVKNEVVLGNNPKMRKAVKTILLPPIELELEEIAALGVPAGDEARVTTIMTGWERALQASLRKPSLLILGGRGQFARPNKLAGEYGFQDCDKVY